MADTNIAYVRDDGAVAIRASALGKCSRALWAALEGVEKVAPSDSTERVFAEGHLHEEALIQQFEFEGTKVTGNQVKVELWVIPKKLVIVGHIDGFIPDQNDPDGKAMRLWEAKSMSRKAFDDWMRGRFEYREGYAWQISVYMFGTGWPEDIVGTHYTVKRRDDGVIDTWLFDEPPKTMKEIKQRAISVYAAWRSHEMPACDVEGSQRFFCDYWFLHDEEVGDTKTSSSGVPVDEVPFLDGLLAEYHELGVMENATRKRKKELKEQLGETHRNGRMEFGSDHFTVEITTRTRETIDKARVKAEMGDDWMSTHTVESTYEVWSVKERKG